MKPQRRIIDHPKCPCCLRVMNVTVVGLHAFCVNGDCPDSHVWKNPEHLRTQMRRRILTGSHVEQQEVW